MRKSHLKIDLTGEKLTFLSGRFMLSGNLHLPAGERPPVVIGSHGLFSNKNSPKQIELALKCNACGIGFFRFDHRGCGQSEGTFEKVTSLKARCIDMINAVQCIRQRPDTGDRLGLFGSSMGGAVCISVAAGLAVDAVVTFAAPVRSGSINMTSEKTTDPKQANVPLGKNCLQTDLSDKLSSLHHILIVHGDADNTIPTSNAHEIHHMAGNPKKLIIQKSGDHRMSNTEHQRNFIKEAANWYKKYLLSQQP